MTIDGSVINALNGLFKVILYSMYLASPLIILILLMAGYEKYKKWVNKETREAQRIIVKMNTDIKEAALTCDTLANQKTQLTLDVETLEKKKEELHKELGVEEKPKVDDQLDIKELNIKQLKQLAKSKNMKGYSKMNKSELLNALG